MKINTTKLSLVLALFAAVSTHAVQAADQKCDGYDPDSAALPSGKGCPKPATTIKYDADCAKLNGCANQRPDGTSARASASKQFNAKTRPQKPVGLLLPAVQAAPKAPGRTADMRRTLSAGNSGHSADTSCGGVNTCNDMIATCLALGGNVTATQYDPGTGAPSAATCYSPGS